MAQIQQLQQENLDLKTSVSMLLRDLFNHVQGNLDSMPRLELLFMASDKASEMVAEVKEALLQGLDHRTGVQEARLEKYQKELQKLESEHATSDESGKSVLHDLKRMFKEGKELLRLNEELQIQDRGDLEHQRQVLAQDQKAVDQAKKQLLISAMTGQFDEEEFQVEEGPSWSLGNANFTLGDSNTTLVRTPRQVGPSSRPPSQPSSRSQSRNRSSVTALRKQRPRSVNLSPQRNLSLTSGSPAAIASRPSTYLKGKRSGSVSPSSVSRYLSCIANGL